MTRFLVGDERGRQVEGRAVSGVPTPASAVLVARLRAAGCVFAEEEALLLMSVATTAADLNSMVDKRIAGFPLEHIVGWAQFCGLRIAVAPGVFIPRRRTEFLVREAAAVTVPGAVVLDLCCGSGAIGIALTTILGSIELHAADVEPAAVACTRRNLTSGGAVYEGDLFAALPVELMGRVDTLVANVPYVPTEAIATMPPEARDHEPRITLDGGDDGLDVLRRVAAAAAEWLAPGGHLLVETSESQAPIAADIFEAGGLSASTAASEEFCATVAIGTRPARCGGA